MLGEFIEASINFQNDTIWTMYLVIVACVFGIAFLMFWNANRNDKK